VQYNYGLALQQARKAQAAEAALLKAYHLNAPDTEVIYALALLYAQQGKWDGALPYARELVRMTPGAPGPMQLLQRVEAELPGRP
jgi:tetratricopeptide (TPR) repeat protein